MPEVSPRKLPAVAGWFLLLGFALPALAFDAKPPIEKPIQAASQSAVVVAEAHYSAEVTDGVARIDCRFVVDARKAESATLPIDFGETAVGTLKADDGDTYLRGLGKGRFALVTSGKGRRTIRLQLLAKVAATKHGHGFTLSGPPAGITTLDVSIAKSNQVVTVSPTLVAGTAKVKTPPSSSVASPKNALSRSERRHTSRVTGHLTSAAKITVSWADRVATAKHKPLITVAEESRVRIEPTAIVAHARMLCNIDRKPVSQLKFSVPKTAKILDVTLPATHSGRWLDAIVADRKIVTVEFAKPARGNVEIRIATRFAYLNGNAALPKIETIDAVRQTGLTAISHASELDLTVKPPEGWTAVTAGDVPSALRTAGAVYFRHSNPETALRVAVKPAKAHITVHQETRVQLETESARLKSNLRYRVLGTGVSSLAIRMPANSNVDSVTGALVKSFDVDRSKSPPVLRVTLKRRATGDLNLTVAARGKISTTDKLSEIDVPLPRPMQVKETTGTVYLNSLSLEIAEVAAGGARLVHVPTPAVAPDSHHFEWTTTPARIVARVKRSSTIPTVRSNSKLHFDETGVDVTTSLSYVWPQLPRQPLRLIVPKSVARSIHIWDSDGSPVRFKMLDRDKTAMAGSSGTTLEISADVFDESAKFFNALTLTANYRLARKATKQKNEPVDWTFLPVVPVDQSGTPIPVAARVALQSSRKLLVGFKNPDDAVTADDGSNSGGYAIKRPAGPLVFRVTPLQPVPQPRLFIARGLVEVAVGTDSNAVYRCRYRIRPQAGERIRVELPKTIELLAAYGNGLSLSLEQDATTKPPEGWGAYLLDVSRLRIENEPLQLCLQFRIPLTPAAFDFSFGKVRVHLPRLADADGTAAVVERLKTAIWVPRRFALVGEPAGMTGSSRTALSGLGPRDLSADSQTDDFERWIGFTTPGDISFPQAGHVYRFEGVLQPKKVDVAYADMTFATWALSLPLLLIGFLLTRTHWQNKLSLVLLLGCGATLAAVQWGGGVYHGLLAARYGLAGVAAWWTVRAIHIKRGRRIVTVHAAHRSVAPPCHLPLDGLTAVVVPPPGTFESHRRSKAA